jgi:catechol-2,3-dioxygenase
MSVFRLNHAVLYVRDVARSAEFYRSMFGFVPMAGTEQLSGAAFLRAPDSTNDHDLGLFEIGDRPAGTGPTVGLYHLAWEVDTLADLRDMADRLRRAGSLAGSSDHSSTKSLYAKDPDGIEFEVVWLVPARFIDAEVLSHRSTIRPLDLDAEIARYGADTPGGVGVSRPDLAAQR